MARNDDFINKPIPRNATWNDDATKLLKPDGTEVGVLSASAAAAVQSDYIAGKVKPTLRATAAAAQAYNPRMLGGNAAGVTVASSTTGPTGRTQFPPTKSAANYESYFLIEGGWRVFLYGAAYYVFAGHANPSAGGADWSTSYAGTADCMARFTFETNDPNPVVATDSQDSVRLRFIVDGQYIDKTGHAPAATSGIQYWSLTFATTKTRRITVESQKRIPLYQVMIQTGYSLRRPPAKQLRMLTVADSFGVGPDIGTGIASDRTLIMQGDSMHQHAADWLGVEGVVSGVGGTGFTAGGVATYTLRWGDVTNQTWDILVVQGSVNDGYTANAIADIKAACKAYWQRAIAAYPTKPMIQTGVFQAADSSTARQLALDTAYGEVVAELNHPYLKFISFQAPAYVTTWAANNAMISADGLHLNPTTGHDAAGRMLAADIYATVMAM